MEGRRRAAGRPRRLGPHRPVPPHVGDAGGTPPQRARLLPPHVRAGVPRLVPALRRRPHEQPGQPGGGRVPPVHHQRPPLPVAHHPLLRGGGQHGPRPVHGRRQRRGRAPDAAGHPGPQVYPDRGRVLLRAAAAPRGQNLRVHPRLPPHQEPDRRRGDRHSGHHQHGLPQLPAPLRVRRGVLRRAGHRGRPAGYGGHPVPQQSGGPQGLGRALPVQKNAGEGPAGVLHLDVGGRAGRGAPIKVDNRTGLP